MEIDIYKQKRYIYTEIYLWRVIERLKDRQKGKEKETGIGKDNIYTERYMVNK